MFEAFTSEYIGKKANQVVTRDKQIHVYLPEMVNNQGGKHKQKRDKIVWKTKVQRILQ